MSPSAGPEGSGSWWGEKESRKRRGVTETADGVSLVILRRVFFQWLMLLRKGYMIGGKEDGGGWRMGDGGWGWKGEGSEAQTNDGKCRKARKGPVINRLSHTHRGRPTLGQGPTEAEAYWMVYSGFWLHEEGETERSRFASLTCHGSCWVASWAKEVVGNHKGKQLSNSQGIGEPPERRAHRTLETGSGGKGRGGMGPIAGK